MAGDLPIVTIYKFHNISAAHRLDLPYESKCNNIHGHNYKVEMWVTGVLDEQGMVVDFHKLKKVVMAYDHVNLNDIMEKPTTAESLSVVISDDIYKLSPNRITRIKIRVWETETAYAEYQQEFEKSDES